MTPIEDERMNMSRKTVNLSKPRTIRLRHDQEEQLEKIIEGMTPSEIEALKNEDRSKFKYPELFKNAGRGTSPVMIILRLALDDYMMKLKREEYDRQNPSLFDLGGDS